MKRKELKIKYYIILINFIPTPWIGYLRRKRIKKLLYDELPKIAKYKTDI